MITFETKNAVICKGDPSIGIYKGQYVSFKEDTCELYDYQNRRIPLKTIEFILLGDIQSKPTSLDQPTLIVVAKDRHCIVNKFDRIVAHGEVGITTSRPAIRLNSPMRSSNNIVTTKHILKHFDILEVL